MIELNGSKFAKNNEEMTESLFQHGGTCSGFYRINKKTISILNLQSEKVGVITCKGVLASATKQDDGRYWYSYANPSIIGEYASYMKQQDDIAKALKLLN